MEKLLLYISIILLFSTNGVAQEKDLQETAYLKVKSGEETITYQFSSLQDFEENSEKILDEIATANPSTKKDFSEELTLEFSLSVVFKRESTNISGSVTANSSTIIAKVKKLRTQLLAIAKDKTGLD